MSCIVQRNKDSKIIGVTTPEGEKSKLFEAIHSNIFLSDPELSLDLFYNSYSDRVKNMYKDSKLYTYDTGEPRLFYQSKSGGEFDNLEELLISDNTGEVKMGFKDPRTTELIPFASFNTDASEKTRFLTGAVQSGVLAAERFLGEDGITRFKGKGFFRETSKVTARMAETDALFELGIRSKVNSQNGTIEFEFQNDGFTQAIRKDGETDMLRIEDIPEAVKDNRYQQQVDLLLKYAAEYLIPVSNTTKPKPSKQNVKNLESTATEFIKSLGVSVATMDSYREQYQTRYGKDIDIRAIADLANNVIAVTDTTDILEETSHLAIEQYNDQESILDALLLVPFTPEYTQYAGIYRSKYSAFYEGAELENQVRKEVLGKILKRTVAERFDTQQKSPEQQTLIGYLRAIWENFLGLISRNRKNYHLKTLQDLNNKIADAILDSDLEQFNQDISSGNFYYNLMDNSSRGIEVTLKASRKVLDDMFRTGLKQPVPSQIELDRIADKMTENSIISSVNTIVGIASNQLSILESNLQQAEATQDIITKDDSIRYSVLTENLKPVINKLKFQLESVEVDEQGKARIQSINSAIDSINTRLASLEPRMDRDKEALIDNLVAEVAEQYNLGEADTKELTDKLDGNIRDLGWFGKMFGLVSHSQNPIIQMIYKKVVDMGVSVTSQFKNTADKTIDSVYDKGLQKYQSSIIKKKDGKKTYYFMSPIDFSAYDNDLNNEQIRVMSELSGKSVEDIARLYKEFTPQEILRDDNLIKEYKKQVKAWKDQNTERRFTDEYYKQRDARFEKANIAEATREYLSTVNATEYNILRRYTNKDGTIDKSKITEAERIEIIDMRKRKAAVKSAYDQFGNLKEGLRRVNVNDLTPQDRNSLPFSIPEDYSGDITLLAPGYDINNLTEEARTALDLSNLTMLFIEEQAQGDRTRNPIEAFIKEIEAIEDMGESAFDWVISNATLTFTQDYYENIGSNSGFSEETQKWINSLPAEERRIKQALLDEYKEKQKIRKDLLHQNRKINRPLETEVVNMSDVVRRKVLELDEDIQEIRRSIGAPSEIMQNMGPGITTRGLNEDFILSQQQSGQSVFDFAQKHMTRRNLNRTNDFALYIEDALQGKPVFPKRSYEQFIQERMADGTIQDGMTRSEITQKLKDSFAQQYVASYYQRYEPNGYQDMMDALKSGKLKVSEVIRNRENLVGEYPALQYIEFAPDYSWSEDVNNMEFSNPNYIAGGYYLQPKVSKYLDNEFFEKYGLSKEEFLSNPSMDLKNFSPSKNKEEYEFLSMMVDLREQSLQNYGEQDVVNKFQLVQMSSTGFEKYARLANLGNIAQLKDSLKDFYQNRQDEKIYGEMLDDNNLAELGSDLAIKVIPKYFLQKLEDPEAITESTLQAALVDLKQSILYKERQNTERVLKALEYKISKQSFTNNGGKDKKNRILKRGEVSNYYQKAAEYIDHHLYGIQQTRHFETQIFGKTIDLSRVASQLQGFARFSNLGFNVFVDLTSATTGVLNNVVDRVVGDYYHKSSSNKANSQMVKLMGQYIGEAGKVNKKTKMNALLEFFEIENVESRISNSRFNRGLRLVQKAPYLMSKLCNMPVTPKVLLTVLNDIRFQDGAFYTYREFITNQRTINPDITIKEIDALWDKIKNDSLYENIDITEDGLSYNQNFRDKFEGQSAQEFDKLRKKTVAKAKQVIQSVDGVLNEYDQVAAQRDVLTNIFMMHRGWLLINLTKRFKKRHFNISAGQIEEGHYISLFNFLGDMARNLKNPSNIAQAWGELQPDQRRNIKRAAVETGFMTALLLLGEAVLAADDEDDTWIENLSQLIYLRTVSEFNSAQHIGIPGSLIETAQSPITAMGTYANLNPIELFSATTEDDSEGNSKFWKKLRKATPLRRVDQWSDLQSQVDAFRFYNDPTLLNLGSVGEKQEE